MIHEINFGIVVGDGLGIKLRNNHVLNCVYGFYIYHSNYGIIENNLVENCERGIHFQMTYYSNFTSNTFVNNSRSGVYIEKGRNNTLTLNELRGNNIGIEIYESKYNLVANNSFIQNYIGLNIIVGYPGTISYVRTEYTTAKFNLFYNNTNYGVRVARYPYFSHIFMNTFYLNNQGGTSQAYDYGTSTLWFDYSLNMGNYWSDWNGTGSYSIDGLANNTDPFPFIYIP